MRKVGVEEELLIVDPSSGEMVSLSAAVLRARVEAADSRSARGGGRVEDAQLRAARVPRRSAEPDRIVRSRIVRGQA